MATFSYLKLRFSLYLAVDTLFRIVPRAQRKKSVLILRQDAIGDFVLWLDAARTISHAYQSQGIRTTLIANKGWAAWAAELGFFDEVLPFDPEAFQYSAGYRLKMNWRVRRAGFSIAVQPSSSRDYSADALIRLSAAPVRIGNRGDDANLRPWERRITDSYYTTLFPWDAAPEMELIRNARFVRMLLKNEYRAVVADLHAYGRLRSDPEFDAEFPPHEPFYVLFPSASWVGKQWPVANFRELAERIFGQTGWRGVVCGGPDDRSLARDLCEQATVPLVDWAGCTTLPQLAAILARARLLVSNDTSAVHIAAATGTQAICLLGGGHFGRFLPYVVERDDVRPLPVVVTYEMPCYGCNWNCIWEADRRKTVPCISNIAVEAAWRAVQTVIVGPGRGLEVEPTRQAGATVPDPVVPRTSS